MKASDFKLLATLPDLYEYTIFEDHNEEVMVVGKNYQSVIVYKIINDELRPINLNLASKPAGHR